MANNSFFPSTDAAALAFAQHFSSMITATPTIYGLVAGQATSYATLVTNYQTCLMACEPTVRNMASTAAKDQAKANLKLSSTQLANIINGQTNVTDAQKIALGLTVRAKPTPVPAPANPPTLDIVSVIGRTVKIRLHNDASTRRARPAGVNGTTIFSYVGATPPADMGSWMFQGSTSKTISEVQFDSTVPPGSVIWLTAFWYNGKGQSGPPCSPRSAYLAGGSVSMAA